MRARPVRPPHLACLAGPVFYGSRREVRKMPRGLYRSLFATSSRRACCRQRAGWILGAAVSLTLLQARTSGAVVDETWSTGTGNWNPAANWLPNTVPSNGANTYRAFITAAGTYTVTLDLS